MLSGTFALPVRSDLAATFLFRSVAIAFNWRTAPVASGTIFEKAEELKA